jgi:hypothetical protein
MEVGYVVLYVNDTEACRRFWIEQVGMVEKRRDQVGAFTIAQVGFADQPFAFELVPLEMMRANPDGLDLATPSICFARHPRRPRGADDRGGRAPRDAELRVLGPRGTLVRGDTVTGAWFGTRVTVLPWRPGSDSG